MTWHWGERSLRVRSEIDGRLVAVCDEVLAESEFDLTLSEGWRDKKAQNEYYRTGASELRWPDSEHNVKPSRAVHVEPIPIDYEDTERYYILAVRMLVVARDLNIKLRWLGLTTLRDLAHWQLEEES